jgi:hypothetical protein
MQILQKLRLFANWLGPEAASYFAEVLLTNTVGLILHLSNFHLHFSIQTLISMDFGLNSIGDKGIQHFANAL